MIEKIDALKNALNKSKFQQNVLTNIENLLDRVDLKRLNSSSFIEAEKGTITIYLVHELDKNTIVILNILENHASLWFGENNIYLDEHSDTGYLGSIYKDCLEGLYRTDDYYIKRKLIFSITYMLNYKDIRFLSARTPFYLFYKWFYKGAYIQKTVEYKSFIT